jgi:hypothetical protein
MPNVLINGCMRFWQRGTSFTSATTPANNDDNYIADRWLLLSDGNDIVDVTQETSTVPTGFYSAMKLDVETADKKFMIVQPVETRNADPLVGGVCSLSFYARAGDSNATVDHLRAAVLSWDSTADTITSDVVSAWGAEGTNPTWATNWTMENTPSDLTLTTSYQRFTIENVSVDTASTANIAVVIWCDNSDGTVGDLVYITGVKLEYGSKATPFIHNDFATELTRCQRYYEKSYNLDDDPGTATNDNAAIYTQPRATSYLNVAETFLTRKRTDPTISIYSPDSGTVDRIYNTDESADDTVSSTDSGESRINWIQLSASESDGDVHRYHWVAAAEL